MLTNNEKQQFKNQFTFNYGWVQGEYYNYPQTLESPQEIGYDVIDECTSKLNYGDKTVFEYSFTPSDELFDENNGFIKHTSCTSCLEDFYNDSLQDLNKIFKSLYLTGGIDNSIIKKEDFEWFRDDFCSYKSWVQYFESCAKLNTTSYDDIEYEIDYCPSDIRKILPDFNFCKRILANVQ